MLIINPHKFIIMKKKSNRWLKTNRQEMLLLICSCVLIAAHCCVSNYVNNLLPATMICAAILLIYITFCNCIKQKQKVIPDTYILAYTVGCIAISIVNALCIIRIENNRFLLTAVICGSLSAYTLGLIIMHRTKTSRG